MNENDLWRQLEKVLSEKGITLLDLLGHLSVLNADYCEEDIPAIENASLFMQELENIISDIINKN